MVEGAAPAPREARRSKPTPCMGKYLARRDSFPANENIKIEIAPYFLPDYSAPEEPDAALFTFGYKVRFINNGARPFYILRRNWYVTDGKREWRVCAPRVGGNIVNELVPRGGTFEYRSAVPLTVSRGALKGYFEGTYASDGTGEVFRTEEKEVLLEARPSDYAECGANQANEDFIRAALPDGSRNLEALQAFLAAFDRGEDVDTRTLTNISLTLRMAFERLLLQRLAEGLKDERKERRLGLRKIHPSFPSSENLVTIAFLTTEEGHGIRFLKESATPSPTATPQPYIELFANNVVPLEPYLRARDGAKGKAQVVNCEETSHSRLVLDRPKIGGAAWKQKLHSLIDKEEYEEAAAECNRAASAKAGASNQGMVSAADIEEATAETTRPALPPKLSPQQVAALTADTPLARLQVRYEKRLREIVLPEDEIKDVEQARAAAALVVTYRNLVKQQTKEGIEPQPQDERVTKAQRLSVAFYRKKRKAHASPRRGRPPKMAANSLA
jgi:uncharacterized protein affecting Mg2+/Co2+ transport